MQAYEFSTQITSDGKIELPNDLIQKLSIKNVKVIVIINDPAETEFEEKVDWARLAAEQFFADDSEADAIYDYI